MVTSPGQANYKVRLKDQSGTVVAEFDTWRSLSFTHLINSPGQCRFEIWGNDSRIDLFELDSQIEVWRRNQNVDLDWYIEWEGFHRTTVQETFLDGNESFVSYSTGYLDLIRRKIISYRSGSVQSSKTGVGETVIKEFVDENAGPSANDPDRISGGLTPGLSIQADAGGGTTWTGARSWKNLLDVIQDIGQKTGLDLDVIGIGAALFEFRTYLNQRGIDRSTAGLDPSTGLNGAGNAPVIFSLGFGNMITPSFSVARTAEKTIAIALGAGVESHRQIAFQAAAALADSPWNHIEVSTNASQESTDALHNAAAELLEANQKIETFTFVVQQLLAQYYGKDYSWGDLITARYKDFEDNKKITEARITVSEQANGEEITLKFADIPIQQ